MPKSRIPSPARSQGAITTPRRQKSRGSRSVCSPALSTASGRLTSIIDQFKEKNQDSFALSPVNTRRSVLTDNTDIEEPRRKSWWKNLNENSRDVMDVLVDDKDTEAVNAIEDIVDIEVLSQENKNYTLDLPESSDNESVHSIVLPQRKLFTLKENQPQKKFGQLVGARETLAKLHKTHNDKTINAGTKNLFQGTKRSKPVFPAALLNISPNKTTADKTKENVAADPKVVVRNIFGSRPANKRKNIFADFIASESEDEISEIQPRVFAFQKKAEQRRISSVAKGKEHSPTSSLTTDMELDEWKLLPSSTMVEQQLDEMVAGSTPVKRARLGKLSEAKESEASVTQDILHKLVEFQESKTNISTTSNKTKQSNKSLVSKLKTPPQNKSNKSVIKDTTINENISNEADDENNLTLVYEDDEQIIDQNRSQPYNNLTTIGKKKTEIENRNITVVLQHTEVLEDRPESQKSKTFINEVEDEAKSLEKANEHEVLAEQEDKIQTVTEDKNTMDVSHDNVETITEVLQLKKVQADKSKAMEADKSNNKEINDTRREDNDANDNEKEDNGGNESEEEQESQKSKTYANVVEDDKAKSLEKANEQEVSAEQQDEIQNGTENKNTMNVSHDKVDTANERLELNKLQADESIGMEAEKNDDEEINETEEENNEASESEEEDNNDANESEEEDNAANESEEDNDANESEEEDNDIQEEEINESHVEENADQNQSLEVEADSSQKAETDKSLEEEDESHEVEANDDENDEENISLHEDNEANESQDIINKSRAEEVDQSKDESENAEDEDMSDDDNVDESQEIEHTDNTSQESEQEENDNETQESENEEEEINESQELENGNQSEEDQEMEDSADDKAIATDEMSEEEQEEMDVDDEHVNSNNVESDVINSEEVIVESTDVTHDTTGRYRKKLKSPEVILHDKTNHIDSFTATGRNTSIRKTKSMYKDLNIRPSLAPPRDSLGLSDGTRDSSAEGSGWDSHRTTRKTLRQTFGKDFTPRKSLRALVMEKAAKQSEHNNMETINNDTVKFPQANSTEYPEDFNREDNVTVESDHELSRRTRQTTLETYLQKMKQQNMEKKMKMEEAIRKSLKAPPARDPLNLFKVPAKPVRKTKTASNKTKKTIPNIFNGELPPEVIEDMKYKPPKRFQPTKASWITKRLYNYLEKKLEPKYDYKARVRAEKLMETIFYFVKELRRHDVASPDAVDVLKHEMARLDIVKTHFEFYEFFHEFMPREVRVKVIPDIVNNIALPRHGVFSDIMRGNTVQG